MGRGRRFNDEPKLNIKKILAVIIAIAVLAMVIFVIYKLVVSNKETGGKLISPSYYTVYTNGKYGVINSAGNIIIEPTYEEMIVIPNNKKDIFICTYDVNYTAKTYKTKVLNANNQEILKGYDMVQALDNYDKQDNIWYEDNVLKVQKDGKYGLIDFTGKELVAPSYDTIDTLKQDSNSILVQKDSKFGLVNNKGTIVIEPQYKQILQLGEDSKKSYIAIDDNGYHIIDIGKKLDTVYEDVKTISANEMFVVKADGKWKLVNSKNETLIEDKFDDIKAINQDKLIFQKDSKYGIMNTKGEEIIPAQYEDLSFCFTDKYIAKKDNKYGIVNASNEAVLDFTYSSLEYRKTADFIEGYNDAVQTDIINSDLKVQLSGLISEINLEKGYLKIRINEEYKYYNFKFEEKKNTELLTQNTVFLSKKDGKYGYTDKTGKVVVDYIYDDATEQNSCGYVAVKKDGKWGSLDRTGAKVAEIDNNLDNNMVIDFIGKWHLSTDLNMNCYTDITI